MSVMHEDRYVPQGAAPALDNGRIIAVERAPGMTSATENHPGQAMVTKGQKTIEKAAPDVRVFLHRAKAVTSPELMRKVNEAIRALRRQRQLTQEELYRAVTI